MTTQITDEELPVEIVLPKIVRGADWFGFTFQFMEDDNVTPKDTTGYTAELIIAESWTSETYKTLSVGSGITHTPSTGTFAISMTDTEVDALDFSQAVHKFIVTDDTGIKVCYFMGTVQRIG